MTRTPPQTVRVEGGARLSGVVELSAAKNSMLRLLVATLLTSERCDLRPFPTRMLDADILSSMLSRLGKRLRLEDGSMSVEEPVSLSTDLDWEGRSVRSVILIASALLTRFGRARVPAPGGCAIGSGGEGERKIDLHLMIYEAMGARWRMEDGSLCVEAPDGLEGADIHLPIRSTGATETGILAGCLARGTTTIWGPHVRPEILDLIAMLREMGADIEVYGQERIVIRGVRALRGAIHNCIPDNVEAFSWVVAAAITQGDIEIRNFPTSHLEVPLLFLREAGVRLLIDGGTAIVRHSHCYPIDISTGPYPGINSDMQPLFAAFALFARGESRIVDLRFEGRYQYARELARMGADLRVDGNMLRIFGGKPLRGGAVNATDLRAGISLLIAGLGAEGVTEIDNAWQIERGYDGVWEKLKGLGARVSIA